MTSVTVSVKVGSGEFMPALKNLRRIQREEDGIAAIEFAMIAPVLFLMMFGIIEFSLIMLVNNIMESSTQISARLGKTGYAEGGKTREETIIDSIKTHAGTLINTSNITITSKSYDAYDEIGDPEPFTDTNHNGTRDAGESYTDTNGNGVWDADQGTPGYGAAGDIVVYTVSYPWPLVTPIIGSLIGNHGVFNITTHAVVKNEPY